MKLVEVQITNFRNFLDSSEVSIDPTVTCLVGKNESGKTAFLHALYRLHPARPNVKLSAPDQYPAWLEKRDRLRGVKIEDFRPVLATFLIEAADRSFVEKVFGPGVLKTDSLGLKRSYGGTLSYTLDTDESAVLRYLLTKLSLPARIAEQAASAKDISELQTYASELASKTSDNQEDSQAAQQITQAIRSLVGDKSLSGAVWESIKSRVPTFFYFHEYSKLPYSVKILELLSSEPATLNDEQLTARALLRLAAAEKDYLLNPNYERRKRELENVANALTEDVLQYWSQNPELRVLPDITQTTQATPQGQQSVLDELKIRIWDQRHSLSLPFNEHSSGFQWFFSFLAAFSEYEHQETPVVILLDEPALGLHARAQADFLRFIDERLSKKHQVIYTTHSPFMVQPGKLERVRLVEDRGREPGAKVSAEILTTDRDTLFPLQGALGYDLAQHLFIGSHNLIVEGTSDYTYLRVLSDHLATIDGRAHLDPRWSIVPVGGADFIPTFVALLGMHLDVTVVVDAQKKHHQRLSHLAAEGYLAEKRIITIGEVLSKKLADIEDLFSPGDYLRLYNKAFGKQVKVGDLQGDDSIVSQLARLEGIDRFDHGKPADTLLRDRVEILDKFSKQTLDNFEELFRRINSTLGT